MMVIVSQGVYIIYFILRYFDICRYGFRMGKKLGIFTDNGLMSSFGVL